MESSRDNRLAHVARICLTLLAFTLPFEAVLASVGPLEVSNLEILLGLVLALTAAHVFGRRRRAEARSKGQAERSFPEDSRLHFPASWLWLWGAFAAAMLLSALLAPEFRLNAAKGSMRLLSGMALALCVPQLIKRRRHLLWIVTALLAGGALSALAGVVEVTAGRPLAILAPFRTAPTSAGPFTRLTGSFDHANQLAMFMEATLPLLVALWLFVRRRSRPHLLLPGAALLLFLQAAVLTYSRSSIATIFLSCSGAALLLWWGSGRKGLRRSLPWAAAAAGILVLLGLNAAVNPAVRLRLQSEGDNEWYNLSFDVPQTLSVDAGDTVTTTVTVRNEGLLTWSEDGLQVVRLAGRWFLRDGETTLGFAPRWTLPETVAPGEALTLQVGLRAPRRAGTYRFRWDMVQENVTWFSVKNGLTASTRVVVQETDRAAMRPPDETDASLSREVEAPPEVAPIPGRRTLWRIAGQEFLDHPLLGIGMDNFRLLYGRQLDFETWNTNIHTNSWYVEMLVSLGLVGALPFFAWMLLVSRDFINVLRKPSRSVWCVAVATGIIAFFIHGILDYFLTFNGTGLLFWVLIGLWAVVKDQRLGVSGDVEMDAHSA